MLDEVDLKPEDCNYIECDPNTDYLPLQVFDIISTI